jgi:hypothetical protein
MARISILSKEEKRKEKGKEKNTQSECKSVLA